MQNLSLIHICTLVDQTDQLKLFFVVATDLIVKNDEIAMMFICLLYTSYTAKSVGQAILLAEKCSPELAILDVMLPDGSGFDLME